MRRKAAGWTIAAMAKACKTLQTDSGAIQIEVPRDRNSGSHERAGGLAVQLSARLQPRIGEIGHGPHESYRPGFAAGRAGRAAGLHVHHTAERAARDGARPRPDRPGPRPGPAGGECGAGPVPADPRRSQDCERHPAGLRGWAIRGQGADRHVLPVRLRRPGQRPGLGRDGAERLLRHARRRRRHGLVAGNPARVRHPPERIGAPAGCLPGDGLSPGGRARQLDGEDGADRRSRRPNLLAETTGTWATGGR